VKDYLQGKSVIQPGTGFTTQPGVAALRRTPGIGIGIDPNPNGVPHPPIPEPQSAFAMWNPVGVRRVLLVFFLGCAVVTATPGCVVKPHWGFSVPGNNVALQHSRISQRKSFTALPFGALVFRFTGSQGVALRFQILCLWHRTLCTQARQGGTSGD